MADEADALSDEGDCVQGEEFAARIVTPAANPRRGAMGTYKCQCCKVEFTARKADRKRGWARFCSKSCKAIKQTQQTGRGSSKQREIVDWEGPFDNTANHFAWD